MKILPARHCKLILLTTVACGFSGVSGTRAAELKFDIKPDQLIAYKLNIEAKQGSVTDRMSGTFAIKGKRAEDDRITVTYTGQLGRTQLRPRTGGFRGGPPRFSGPPRIPSLFGGVTFGGLIRSSNELTLTRKGALKKFNGNSQVPYLIGNISLLPFEMLPDDGETEWQWGRGITVSEDEESDFFRGPLHSRTIVKVGGSESTSYKLTGEDDELVTIATTYELHSPAADRNDEVVDVTGTGTLVFNQKDGVVEKHSMKRTYVISQGGSKITLPLTISLTRMPREDYEKQEKERAERIAQLQRKTKERNAKAAAAAKAAAGKKLDPEKRKQIMADLNSSHWPAVQNRIMALSRFVPHPDDFDIALRIKELRKHKVAGVFINARKQWDRLEPIVEKGQKEMQEKAAATVTASADNPFTTDDEETDTAALRKMREWKSGAFSVTAQFVKFDDKSIVLKRKDGKEITVPVSKLSEPDQKVIATLRKSIAAATEDEENPFK